MPEGDNLFRAATALRKALQGGRVVRFRSDVPLVLRAAEQKAVEGSRIAAPCYLSGAGHIVLPAFSADARGVNVLGMKAWQRYRCYVPAGDEVLDLGEVAGLGRVRRAAGRR